MSKEMRQLRLKYQGPRAKAPTTNVEADWYGHAWISLGVRRGREGFATATNIGPAEALLLAEWLRETALEIIRKHSTVEATNV